jgi:NDP-sugar pyrophosphorylase family protein
VKTRPLKAMVLAAGLGLRMRPLTRQRAKPVLPVLNRPLLHWTLERLARQGVTECVVNLHHRPETVVAAVGDGRQLGLRVLYSHERRILGTGGGPRKVREVFGDEPFLLVNGDVLFDFDLTRLLARHRAAGAQATLALKENPDPRLYAPVVTGAGGWVLSLAGLPRSARGRISLFTGIHVLDPSLLDRLPAGRSDNVRDLYAPLLKEGGRVLGVRVRGAWYDLGRPSLYLAAQLRMLNRLSGRGGSLIHPRARVSTRARVASSVVGARAVVGPGARLSRSVLWEGVQVGREAWVRGSILTEGVRVAAGEHVLGRVVVGRLRVELT